MTGSTTRALMNKWQVSETTARRRISKMLLRGEMKVGDPVFVDGHNVATYVDVRPQVSNYEGDGRNRGSVIDLSKIDGKSDENPIAVFKTDIEACTGLLADIASRAIEDERWQDATDAIYVIQCLQ